METRKMLSVMVAALGVIIYQAKVSDGEAIGTAFTYQGRLMDANSPADGVYDFEFRLYNHATAGAQQGSTIDINDLDVIDGYFTVVLDFCIPLPALCEIFNGNARWLEIGIRPGQSPDEQRYTILSPRQKLTPAPYALYAETAGEDEDWMVSDNDMYSMPSGNIGIGVTNPSQKLEVAGTTKSNKFRTTLNSGAIGLEMNLTSTPGGGCAPFAIWDARNGDGSYLFGIRQETDNLVFRRYTDYWEGNLGIMTFDGSGGNVGIGTGSPGSRLTVNGLVESVTDGFKFPDGTIQETAFLGSGFPSGGITMWSGSLSSIPAGWALCDGTNGTPDLTDRFILGTLTGQNPAGTGGSHQVTLTTSQLPPHVHDVNTEPAGEHSHAYSLMMVESIAEPNIFGAALLPIMLGYTNYSGDHTHTGTALSAGGGQPFDNRPAYYKLAFIMKL